VLVRGVPALDLLRARRDVARAEHPVPGPGQPLGVPHHLAVRRRLPCGVEVPASQLRRRDPEQGRAPAQDVLDHQHPLRTTEAAEGGLRRLVRARDAAVHPHVGTK
jgi:hypothetical protein